MQRFLLLFFITLTTSSYSVANIIFEKSIGSPSCYEEGFSILALNDEQYLLSAGYNCTGTANDWNSYQIYLDKQGEITSSFTETPLNGLMTLTNDQHIIYAGGERAGMNYDSIRIFKSNLSGDILWETPIAFATCRNNVWDITTNDKNEIFITGTYPFTSCSNPMFDAFVMKLDADGNIIWTQTISGDYNDHLHSVKPTPEGGVVAFGWSSSYSGGVQEALLVKLDHKGVIQWTNTYMDSKTSFPMTFGYGIEVTDQNEYLMIGYSDQIYAFKTDSTGEVIWENRYGDACGGIYFKTLQTKDGGYAFLANKSTGSGCRTTLFKTYQNGQLAWEKTWDARLKDVFEKSDGSFLLTGYVEYLPQIHVIHFDTIQFAQKIDADRQLTFELFNHPESEENNNSGYDKHITDIKLTPSIFGFPVDAKDQNFDITNVHENEIQTFSVNVFPVPSADQITFQINSKERNIYDLNIYDMQGRLVEQYSFNYTKSFTIRKGKLLPGNYIYKLTNDSGESHTGYIFFK